MNPRRIKNEEAFASSFETAEKLLVIANQPAGWCGDPLNLRGTYVS